MAPKAEKVYQSEEYRPRKRMCSCCSNLIPSFKQEQEADGYTTHMEKKWYNNKYAGPILFTLAILGAAMLNECTNRDSNPSKNSLQERVSSP